eukprot:CAMPEP_0197468870 /NCGR_PEP_ID=MMETSP1175-20131217/66311_1 /TAXON_ID=1003142 /ORGANISM="Triceratium dubium, Strain CCMP147" /LENGTH=40 /DNA_ID= /DNA_START= /DNA_END= /DNA_ORIENTATION=
MGLTPTPTVVADAGEGVGEKVDAVGEKVDVGAWVIPSQLK